MKNSTKELMQQAGEIQDSLSGDILGLATYFRSAKESLNKDGMLSSKGVMEKEAGLKRKMEVAAMQMIADKHREYKEILSKAKASAQAELLREVPAVDAQTKAIFDADLIQLRGNIMFGTTPERSAKHLAELVEKASVHPSLAKQVQEEYLQLGAAIAQRVGHSEQGMKLRNELLNGHNKLNKATKADGYEEAQRSLADIAEMENVQFISNAKYDRVFSEISGDNILKQFANDSERYFDVHRERVLRVQMQNPDMQGAAITE
ncbi:MULTISPECIES: hypothetical protein [Bacillus]|uniref:hypothetical protein n=1 Tax=Bacillus TaxID=1386 RepID=UPI0001A06688|nr:MULTISPECIES: hypothetical protein [Bacillus]ASK15049.1 hypothetical protein BA201_14405 [Bacillus cereus]EEK94417.1 hypothetical protein bcere0012_26710 [Bacillus cereus BDRD-ST24]EKS7862771.1 hypothetical protein [Bacillus cereus]KXY94525.1 hypothetical protein AT279_02145 [Bacillus cereus]MBL3740515.1 hypothetical protein [Bacillus cereus]